MEDINIIKPKILNINGSSYIFNSAVTIFQLMNYLGFNKNVIVIDYNGAILEMYVSKGDRKSTRLNSSH